MVRVCVLPYSAVVAADAHAMLTALAVFDIDREGVAAVAASVHEISMSSIRTLLNVGQFWLAGG